MLQHNNDFTVYQSQHLDLKKHPHKFYDRDKEPELMKKEVDDKLLFHKKASNYRYALIRSNPTLNTAWLCENIY